MKFELYAGVSYVTSLLNDSFPPSKPGPQSPQVYIYFPGYVCMWACMHVRLYVYTRMYVPTYTLTHTVISAFFQFCYAELL